MLEKFDTTVNNTNFLGKAVSLTKFTWCATEVGFHCAKYSPSGRLLALATTWTIRCYDDIFEHSITIWSVEMGVEDNTLEPINDV